MLVGGERVDIGPVKQRTVLAVLMMSAGQSVAVETLIDRVWGDAAPEQARNTLYSYIARLRAVLRPHLADTGHGIPLRHVVGGYVLDIPADTIDCHRFRLLVTRARDRGNTDQRRRTLFRDAFGEWHGRPLDGLAGEWADAIRYQLEQYRISAVVEWSELALRTGEHGVVIDQLNALLSEYPLAEALVRQLMLALHGAGRSAEALERYATARGRIVSELGAEPGAALRAVHQDILLATSAVARPSPRPPAGEPAWRGLRPHLNRLIGRDEERAQLRQLVDGNRLVTVTGVGGCGKTALALDVAYAVTRETGRTGVALPLATATTAEQVVHTLRALLGGEDDSQDPLAVVARMLGAGPALLVLDNCEHLAAELGELVLTLLGNVPDLVILATSRQPLSVSAEALLTLEPLAVPAREHPVNPANPAVALFVERVRNAAPSVTITGKDLEYIGEICRRLDGLPLALELVAARARTFSFEDLVNRLGYSMTLLFRTTARNDSRHRTMDATLDWSFRLLSDGQRRLLARMAVFVGGFSARDVEEVCGFAPLDEYETPAVLAALVDRSLVQAADHNGTRRYRLLEVIKNFADRQLADLGEQTVTATRHFAHWLDRAREFDRLPRYHQRLARLHAMRTDAANLRQSLEFGFRTERGHEAAEIIATMFEFWLVHAGYLAEGRSLLERALSVPEAVVRADVRALLRFHQALVVKFTEDELRGLHLMREVIGDLRKRRPREFLEGSAAILNAKQAVLDPSALDDVEATVAFARRSAEHDDVLTVTNAAAGVLTTWGRYDQALAVSLEFDRRHVELGASSRAAMLTVRIEAAIGLGDLTMAAELVDRLLELLGDVTHMAEHDSPRRVIALFHLTCGEVEKARRFLDDAWTRLRAAHPPVAPRLVYLRILLAEAQRRQGRPEEACRTLCGGLAAATGRSQYRLTLTGVLETALIAADLGDDAACRELTLRWDTLRGELGLPVPTGFTDAAAHTLGLDPAPPARTATAWHPDRLHACVASARAWCERTQRGPRRLGRAATS